MATARVLLYPRKLQSSRTLDGVNQYFTAAQRAMGTSDIAVCGWLYCTNITINNALLHCYSAGGVWLGASGSTFRIQSRLGGGLGNAATAAGAIVVNTWNFIVVNYDRSGNALGYLNDMSTAAVTLDISADVAVDWGSGLNPWRIGRDGLNQADYTTGRLARVGVIVGDLLTEDDRVELYNSGRSILFADLSVGLAAKFASQDYWNMHERSGNPANQATAARPLTAINSPGHTGPPRR